MFRFVPQYLSSAATCLHLFSHLCEPFEQEGFSCVPIGVSGQATVAFLVKYTDVLTTLQMSYFYQSTALQCLGKLLTILVRRVKKCLLVNRFETSSVFSVVTQMF
jgi:hypothetical protein